MSDKKPLYKQIMDKLKERIKSGDFEYDAPFVTEDRITKEYGVSRITAIRALEELEHDGLINRKRGSGSFVSKNAMSILGKNKEDNAAVTIHKKNRDISLVALVMPFDIKLGNMFKCFDGVNSVLNKENCFVSIYNANRSVENEEKILRSLLEQGIDGVICYPVRGGRNFEVYNQFLVKKIPLGVFITSSCISINSKLDGKRSTNFTSSILETPFNIALLISNIFSLLGYTPS